MCYSRKKRPKKEKLKGLESSFSLLKKLEVALRTNDAMWTEEFCDHPNNGHLLLIEYLKAFPALLELKSVNPILTKEEASACSHHRRCV